MKVKIGIIGGTGIYDPKMLKNVEEIKVETPYGEPSSLISTGDYKGKKLAFLFRHGSPSHTIPPHKVNSQANIWALKSLGVERIIGLAAVGSLRENIKPGDIVIPDQFIDMTKQRKLTFYDGKKVVHISMADPFCSELRSVVNKTVEKLHLPFHKNGIYLCVEGPRFSTRAESKLWRIMQADIVGMTLVPEAQLARELELCYLCIASITDWDVYTKKPVSTKEVLETMKKNTVNIQIILKELIPKIPARRKCECKHALKDAVV